MSPVTIPAIAGGQVERYPGGRTTFAVKSGQTVRGGRLVEITASMEVQEAGAASLKVVGIALHDADPAGEIKKVTVASVGIWNMVATGAVTAGDLLLAGAGGTVTTVAATDATSLATLGTGLTNAKAIIGRAVEAISNAAAGAVLLQIGGDLS